MKSPSWSLSVLMVLLFCSWNCVMKASWALERFHIRIDKQQFVCLFSVQECQMEHVLSYLGHREWGKRWTEMRWVWAEAGSLIHHIHVWWIESVRRVLNHFEWPVLSVSEADDCSLSPPKRLPMPMFMTAMSLSEKYELALGCPSWWSLSSSYALFSSHTSKTEVKLHILCFGPSLIAGLFACSPFTN